MSASQPSMLSPLGLCQANRYWCNYKSLLYFTSQTRNGQAMYGPYSNRSIATSFMPSKHTIYKRYYDRLEAEKFLRYLETYESGTCRNKFDVWGVTLILESNRNSTDLLVFNYNFFFHCAFENRLPMRRLAIFPSPIMYRNIGNKDNIMYKRRDINQNIIYPAITRSQSAVCSLYKVFLCSCQPQRSCRP